MYQTACGLREKGGWGLAPSEFWQLSPQEWWELFDINIGFDVKEAEETRARVRRLYEAAQ